MLDFDVAVLVGTCMLYICTYVCFGKLVFVFWFCSLRACLEVTPRLEFELLAMISRTHYILLLLSLVIAWKV